MNVTEKSDRKTHGDGPAGAKPHRPRWRKKRWWLAVVLGALVILIGLFALQQFVMYHVEGGVFVADDRTEPPVTSTIYYKRLPLSEAIFSTEKVGYLNSQGEAVHEDKPLLNWFDKWAYWNAIRKFPTLESCLRPDGRKTRDLSKFYWLSMRTNTQVKVCLFHLAAKLRNPQKIALWAEGQGFLARLSSGPKGAGIHAVWQRTGSGIDTPYPLFSKQTVLEQYHPFAVILGVSGTPEWQLYINNEKRVFSVKTRNEPNDILP